MKSTLLSFAFLGMSLFCCAQKQFKNDFSAGYLTVGEFFDATALKVSTFHRGKNISLKYTRHIKKKFIIGVIYNRCYFQYVPPANLPAPLTIESRYQKTLTANLGLGYTKWGLIAHVKTGLRFNIRGNQSKFIRASVHSQGWGEAYGEIYEYSKIGPTLGASIAHPIFWRFFGEIDCEYAHLFSGVDRNQLLLFYRIGFRF